MSSEFSLLVSRKGRSVFSISQLPLVPEEEKMTSLDTILLEEFLTWSQTFVAQYFPNGPSVSYY
jgi:hypothetical protein